MVVSLRIVPLHFSRLCLASIVISVRRVLPIFSIQLFSNYPMSLSYSIKIPRFGGCSLSRFVVCRSLKQLQFLVTVDESFRSPSQGRNSIESKLFSEFDHLYHMLSINHRCIHWETGAGIKPDNHINKFFKFESNFLTRER